MTHQARLTRKSQVTIPKDVREVLGLKPGDYVEYDVAPSGQVTIKAASAGARTELRLAKFDAALKRYGGLFHDGRATDEKMQELRGGFTP